MTATTTGSILDQVRVEDVMTRRVASARPDWSLAAVGRKMATEGIHCVVVAGIVTRHGRDELSWSIVSDQDLIRRCATGDGRGTAGDLARAHIIVAEPADTLRDAARRMAENSTSHLVVVEPNGGEPVGLISSLDIAGALGRNGD